MFNLAHSIPYSAIHIILSCIISTFLVTVNANKCFNNIFGYMQKSTLFTSLSFLLKVQFVRQLASFSKDVCNLLVAANPAFIQQESAAVFPLF